MGKPTTPRKSTGESTRTWVNAFLAGLSQTGNVTEAARLAKIDRGTAYDLKTADPAFAQAWENALDAASDLLELEARRRAVEGVEEPVFQGGEQVGTIRRYSDSLLTFLLKGSKPGKYADRRQLSGPDGKPIETNSKVSLEGLTDEQLAILASNLKD